MIMFVWWSGSVMKENNNDNKVCMEGKRIVMNEDNNNDRVWIEGKRMVMKEDDNGKVWMEKKEECDKDRLE